MDRAAPYHEKYCKVQAHREESNPGSKKKESARGKSIYIITSSMFY
jgi:hypothetical protein